MGRAGGPGPDTRRVRGLLRPHALDTLLPAAAGGPIAIVNVNVSRWRCDALIVTSQGVRSSALPDLTLDAALERTNTYLATLQHAELAAIANDQALTAARRDPRPATIRHQIRAAAAALAPAGHDRSRSRLV